jgi:hypothetical protein
MIGDFFVEILAGTTEMFAALGIALTSALELVYADGVVQPIGTLVLSIAGISLAYVIFNFVLGFVKAIGARAAQGKK